MVALSPRLEAVAGFVLKGRPMADIGTDHAYLPAYLIQSGLVAKAIAGDLMPGPLAAARSTVLEAGLMAQIELRLGSGLQILAPGEVATAVLCGMGGPLITEILSAGPLATIERLVLQPMGGEERVRQWLALNGWRLVAERLVEDGGRLYLVMVAEPGRMELTDGEMLVGPLLRRPGDLLLNRYVALLADQIKRALKGARGSHTVEARTRVTQLEQRLRLLEEAISGAKPNGQ